MKAIMRLGQIWKSVAMSATRTSRHGGAILWLLLFIIVVGAVLLSLRKEEPSAPAFAYTASDNKLTITKYDGVLNGDVKLPATLGGLPVIAIGDSAFSDCQAIISMTLPDTVTNIGNAAFQGCHALLRVTIPNGVTNIGDHAFSGCDHLAGILIPDSVASIGCEAFADCSNLTDVAIGTGVTSIGTKAFANCINIASIVIPNGVANIGDWAFIGCTNLANVSFQGKSPISSKVFANDSKSTVYYLPGTNGWGKTFGKRSSAALNSQKPSLPTTDDPAK
jgi:hypothetical protein